MKRLASVSRRMLTFHTPSMHLEHFNLYLITIVAHLLGREGQLWQKLEGGENGSVTENCNS